MTVKIFFHGACRPINPGGWGSYGWVAYVEGKRVAKRHDLLPEDPEMSNNAAEYAALIDAMKWVAKTYPDAEVEFLGDTNLVIEQMAGRWKIGSGSYAAYARQAKDLIQPTHRFSRVSREQNREAAELSERDNPATK